MSKEKKTYILGPSDEKIPGDDADDRPVDQLDPSLKQYRDELEKQYEIPKINVGFLTILKYGTPLDYLLQLIGAFASIGAGFFPWCNCADYEAPHSLSCRY